jgi:prefoldin subunit 4
LSRSYKIGDSFFALSVPEVQELLEAATTKADTEATKVEERLDGVREEMRQLKVDLYARFGRSINLEA